MDGFGLELPFREAKDEGASSLVDALWQHKVLVLRDATLSPREFVRLGRRFGELEIHPNLPHASKVPEIAVVETGLAGTPSSEEWHFDSAWNKPTSSVTILRNVSTPPSGGDTLYLDAVGLADRMISRFGEEVCKLRVTYRSATSEHRVSAPLLRRHPHTGHWAALVNRHLIRGPADPHEFPVGLLAWLDDQLKNPKSYRVRWMPSSVVIWDNLATLHRLSYDFAPFVRRMERMSVAGYGVDSGDAG